MEYQLGYQAMGKDVEKIKDMDFIYKNEAGQVLSKTFIESSILPLVKIVDVEFELVTGEKLLGQVVYKRHSRSDGWKETPLFTIGSSCAPCSVSIETRQVLPFAVEYVICLCGKHYVCRTHFHSTRLDEDIETVILLPQELWVVKDETKRYEESRERE